MAENPIEVPDALVREQMRRLYLQQRRRETGREPSEADYAVDPETLRETYEAQAREMVRGQLLLRRIGEAAGITVEPAEVDAEVASLAARMAQNPEALKAAMARNGTLQALETRLRERKIFATILAAIDVTDTLVSEEAGA
ncbi:MAG: hypothetical protein KatS3mg131_1948 [Candidatus Tectimicrobiota bacterium]|nr:MAG: hypothetical protein KatS3mg131_1948 [Candidatus Tectomicrobia bacterium]